jgi:hypothetical protein
MIDSATLTGLLSVAPSTDIEEVLIPIVAIVGGLTIPILALTFAHRKQQMQARIIERAIEQGLTVEEIDELLSRQGFGEENEKKAKQSRAVPFRAGLVVFAIGAAFFLAENPHIVGAHGGWMPEGFLGGAGNFVAYILMGIGGALIASDLLAIFFAPDKDKE